MELTPCMAHASRTEHGQNVEIFLEKGYIELSAESGRGHTCSFERVYIPLDVICAMLDHAGYHIEHARGE